MPNITSLQAGYKEVFLCWNQHITCQVQRQKATENETP